MAVSFDDAYRKNAGVKISVRIGQAIKDGELPDDEVHELCAYVLVAIQDMRSEEEYLHFLITLTARWPFFRQLADSERAKLATVTNIETMFAEREAAPAA